MPDPTKPTLIPKSPKGTMNTFLEPSNIPLSSYNLEGEALDTAEKKLGQNYMMDDVVNKRPEEISLHTMLTGDDLGTTPEDRVHITVDAPKMAAAIEKDPTYSYDDKQRYLRTVQIIDAIQKNNLTITKAPSGRYWLESNEDGTRHYAKNSILEVSDLLKKYEETGEKVDYGDKAPVENEDRPLTGVEILRLAEEGYDKRQQKRADDEKVEAEAMWRDDAVADVAPEFELEYYDKLKVVATATDLVSSIGGMAGKATVLGAPIGAAVNIAGGIGAMGLEAYGDYLDPDVTMKQLLSNLALRAGAETLETFTGVPASLGVGLKKVIPIARKFIRWGLKAGTIESIMATDWAETFEKDLSEWQLEDYKKASLAIHALLSAGGATIAGKNRAKQDMRAANKQATQTVSQIRKKGDLGDANASQERAAVRVAATSPEKTALKTKQKALTERVNKTASAKKEVVDTQISSAKKNLDADYASREAKIRKENTVTKPIIVPLVKRKAIKKTDTPKVKAQKRLIAKDNEIIRKQNAAAKQLQKKQQADLDTKLKQNKASKEADAAAIENASVDAKSSVDATAESRVNVISKAAAKDRKKLVAKKKEIIQAKRIQRDNKKNATTVEKEVERVFGSPSKKWRDKAQDDVYGKTSTAKTRAKAKAEADAKTAAESDIGKAKAKASKMEAEFAANKDKPNFDAEAKRREIDLQKDKVAKLEKKADNRFRKAGKRLVAKRKSIGKKIGTKAKSAVNYTVGTSDSYKGIGNRALGIATRLGEPGKALTDDKDYEYSTKDAKSRLKQNFGYTDEDLLKFNGNQLRELLKREEGRATGDDGDRTPAKVRFNPTRGIFRRDVRKTIQKKRLGGKLLIAKPGTVIKAQEGVVTLNDQQLLNMKMNGELKNMIMSKEYQAMSEEQKTAAQDAVIAKYEAQGASKSPMKFKSPNTLLKYLKISDFGKRSAPNIDTFALRNLRAPVTYSAPVTNMPGFESAMNELDKPLRIDSADSFQTSALKTRNLNARIKNKIQLIAKNAEHVLQGKANQLNVRNQNEAANAQAYNQNMAMQNAAEANFTQQVNAAESKARTENIARRGRIANSFYKGIEDTMAGKKREELASEFNRLAGLKNKWITEYLPRVEQVRGNKDAGVAIKDIKIEFMENSGKYNPDNLEQDLLNIRSQYENYK